MTARNERKKLTATYLNGLAIAIAAVGGFSPVINFVQTGAASIWTFLVLIVCGLLSGGLHSLGLWLLKGIEE